MKFYENIKETKKVVSRKKYQKLTSMWHLHKGHD